MVFNKKDVEFHQTGFNQQKHGVLHQETGHLTNVTWPVEKSKESTETWPSHSHWNEQLFRPVGGCWSSFSL